MMLPLPSTIRAQGRSPILEALSPMPNHTELGPASEIVAVDVAGSRVIDASTSTVVAWWPAVALVAAAQEAAAAAISITSNGRMPGWLGELYLRLGKAVVFHLHAFFVRGQTIIRAHLLHPSPHRRTVS